MEDGASKQLAPLRITVGDQLLGLQNPFPQAGFVHPIGTGPQAPTWLLPAVQVPELL